MDLSFPADMMFNWQLVSSLAFASTPCPTNPDDRINVTCLQECTDARQPLVVEGDTPLPFSELQAWDEARILELVQAVPGGYQTHNGLAAFCLYILTPEVPALRNVRVRTGFSTPHPSATWPTPCGSF